MKKIILTALLCLGMSAQTQASDLSDKMLELFKSSNKSVSLGAMLIADNVLDDQGKLENYVKWSLKKSDPPLDRTVKLYFLSRVNSDYNLQFIKEFPEDPKIFNEVLSFVASLTRSVSGLMVMYLASLSECYAQANSRNAAREKVERMRMVQMLSGWAAEIFPDEFEQCPNRR